MYVQFVLAYRMDDCQVFDLDHQIVRLWHDSNTVLFNLQSPKLNNQTNLVTTTN